MAKPNCEDCGYYAGYYCSEWGDWISSKTGEPCCRELDEAITTFKWQMRMIRVGTLLFAALRAIEREADKCDPNAGIIQNIACAAIKLAETGEEPTNGVDSPD